MFPAAAVTGAGGVQRVLRRVLLVLAAAMSWLAVSAFPGVAAPTPLSAGTEGPPPLPPIAVFEAACEDLTCFLDASASFDPDGAIVSYDWDFGDGTHGQGIAREQVFGEPGTYTIVLTVTDQSGISSAFSQTVTLQLPTGLPPAQSTPPDIVVPPPPTETRYSYSEGPVPGTETGAGSSPPLPGQAAQEILDRCFEGTLVFRPPSPMEQGETTSWSIRVALHGSDEDPSRGLPGDGPVETRAPRLCEFMRAELAGDGMDITATSGAGGLISLPAEGVGEWSWDITPREAGEKEVTLRLLAPGPEGSNIMVETYRETIDVQVRLGYVVGNAVKEWAGPLGLSVPVVVGAIGALYLWWQRRRYKPKHAPASGTSAPPSR